ncbi:restriction endonuclease subunit S [Bacteroides fragilis]|uniref:restriction endonuclease subunit S n=1 Tax=Bacteroides fragilis TaxID=817 RepID=UPI0004537A67|nr:restriction endonuclease subunit S [Bacteroides fragilis]EYB15346.1 type I restriction modification DNA specificity domain protein [Bacteroides fragilis str. S38L3]MCZ2692327.1 restriction endonuclease subunit S [Bacteroides fragilis]
MANNNENKVLNVPNLRFPEFSGEWKKCTIDDLCEEFKSGKNIKADNILNEGEYPVFGGNGLRGYTDCYNHEGDYVLIGRQGALCGNIRFVTGKTYITEHAIAAKATNNNNTRFLESLFIQLNLGKFSDQSAQPGLAVNKLLKIETSVPSKDEQEKIASLLQNIDKRIATQNKIIEDLKKLKSAIIHRCYSSKTNMISLSELLKQCSERNHSGWDLQVLSVSNRYGFIAQSDQFEDREVASDDTSNYKIVEKGMFAYNPARINVGSIALYEMDGKGIVSPMYVCFTTKHTLLPGYLKHYFASQAFRHEMYKRLEGSVRLCLTFEGLCNIEIPLPSIEIQENVGKYLSTIEHKVSLEKSVLSQYQLQRSYLLSQMFI